MIYRIFVFIKPFVFAILLLIVLQCLGLLSMISNGTQELVMKTGYHDFKENKLSTTENFDFNFKVKDLNGNKINFEQYKGKVVFINLWATWCGPCRAEMPAIQKLYDDGYKDKVNFIMLSVDKDRDFNKVVDFIADKKYTFPVFISTGFLGYQLVVPSIPTTFIVAKDGRIVAKEIGTTNFNTTKFKKFLDKLIQE